MLAVFVEVAVMLLGVIAAAIFSSALVRCGTGVPIGRWLPALCQALLVWTLIVSAIWAAGGGWHAWAGVTAAALGIVGGWTLEVRRPQHQGGN